MLTFACRTKVLNGPHSEFNKSHIVKIYLHFCRFYLKAVMNTMFHYSDCNQQLHRSYASSNTGFLTASGGGGVNGFV